MANQSVLELAVGTGKWDAGLKKAMSSLNNFTQANGGLQKAMEKDSASMAQFVKMMGNMDTQSKGTKGQMRELSNAVTELTASYRALSDEQKNSDIGRAMAESIQTLTERAGQARDVMVDVKAAINNAASDTRTFDQLSAGASFITSSFQSLQGAAKLVGIEMGDNVQVIAKLQAAMAVTNGLTTIQTSLQKQSALMQGVATVKTLALNAAKALEASTTKAATVAQAAFNAVAKANPYVLLATAVAGVAAAMIAFGGSTDEATEAEKRQQQETEALKKVHDEFSQKLNDSVGNAVGDTTAKFITLQDQWKQLRGEAQQKAWIDANQSAFNALGLSVHNVNTAYKVFIDQAPDVIAALQAIAEAKALESFKEEQLKEYFSVKYFAGENKRTKENGGLYTPVEVGQTFGLDEAKRLGLKLNKDIAWGGGGQSGHYYLTGSGAAMVNQYRNDQAVGLHHQILNERQGLINQIDKDLNAARQRAADLSKNLPYLNGGFTPGKFNIGRGGGHTGTGGNTTNTDKKDEAPVGSKAYYENKIKELKAQQEFVTNNNDYENINGQISVYAKKIDEITGNIKKVETATGQSGATGSSLSDWISAQQNALGGMGIGAQASQTYANIIDATALQNIINWAIANDVNISPDTIESLWEKILNGEDIPDSVWTDLTETINDATSELDIEPIKIDVDTGNIENVAKTTKEGWKDAAAAVQSVGQALQQVENPGAKVAGIIGEAIANIALGFAEATAKGAALGPFGWIAAIAGGLGTMLSTIAAIKQATSGYAEGGVVGGNFFSGDKVPALLNSGETVLTQAQTNNLASAIRGGHGNGESKPFVTGEIIYLGVNNYLRRTGRGEIITSNSR